MKRQKKGGGKFPQDVARFFNTHKRGTNAQYTKDGMLIALARINERMYNKAVASPYIMQAGQQGR